MTRKKVILAGLWLFSVLLANYVGGVVGFIQGSTTELALSGSDALGTVTTLRLLRDGNVDQAILLLETQLDSEIARGVFGEHSYDSPYNVMRLMFGDVMVAGNAYAFSSVLEYREEVPSSHDDEVSTRMMEGLEAFRDAPRPNHAR